MSISIKMLAGAVAWYLSFAGLSALLRTRGGVLRFNAPFVAASLVIVLNMFGGMTQLLKPMTYVLYAVGLLGWICVWIKDRPDWLMLGAGALSLTVLYLIMGNHVTIYTDDYSHWLIAVKNMLQNDAFPDASVSSLFFQSYPHGAATFIYYALRWVGDQPGIAFVAQNFLCLLGLLPMLSVAKGRKRWIVLVTMAFLFIVDRYIAKLQVDWLLAYMGIGIVGMMASNEDNLLQAVLCGLLGMMAIVFVKSSGMYFAVIGAAYMAYILKRGKKPWGIAIVALALSVGCFVLWQFYVKCTFPAGLDTKHAVSLAAYAEEMGAKSWKMILGTPVRMVIQLFRQTFRMWLMAFVLLGLLGFSLYNGKKHLDGAGFCNEMVFSMGAFVLWMVMLYLMYIFSMPASETHELASYPRYLSTGIIFAVGLAVMAFVRYEPAEPRMAVRCLSVALTLCMLMGVGIAAVRNELRWLNDTPGAIIIRKIYQGAEECGLGDGARCVAFIDGDYHEDQTEYGMKVMRYVFNTRDVFVIYYDEMGTLRLAANDVQENGEDPLTWLRTNLPTLDGILVYGEAAELEAIANEIAPEKVYKY